MADRSVKVSLLLNATGYMQGVEKASVKTRELGTESEKLAAKKEMFNTLGVAALGFGAAVGAGVALAVSKFAEFDEQMSYVQAATHETAENMELLRDASLDAGASTVFSATEAAQAVEELAKAGVSTADILAGALAGSMDLAAAGGLGVARAAEISATALQQFGLDGSEASHVADVLAAGAGKAMGSVEDLAQGLKFVGPIAASMGVSIEETTGVLALFAQQGIIGEQAGTSLRGMLSSLTSPSSQARREIEALGISLYDSNGDFMGLENAAGQLSEAYSGMTGEARDASLGIIFGNQQITAATALYKAGAGGVEEWTQAVDDSGYAAETAALRLDNLKGDWEALTGALDTAFISMGEGANGPLRFLVQSLTDVVDKFNDLPDWAQQSTLALGVLTGAAALATGAFFVGVPKIAAYNAALATMGPNAQRASRFVTSVGKAAGGAAVLFGLAAGAAAAAKAMGQLGDSAKSADQTMQLLRRGDIDGVFDGLSASANGVRDLQSALDNLLASDPGSAFNRWGNDTFAFTGLESSTGKAREAFDTIGQSLADLVNNGDAERAQQMFNRIATSALEYGYTTEQVMDLMPDYADALANVENANGLAADSTDDNSDALRSLAGQAEDTGDSVDDLADIIRGFGSAELDTRAAARELEAAFDDLQASIDENGTTLDITTEKGRANQAQLDESATSVLEYAASVVQQTGDQEAANAVIASGRERLIEMLSQLGITGQKAEDYADKLGLIPANVQTAVTATTDVATQKLQAVKDLLAGIPNVKRIRLEGYSVGNFDVTHNATGNLYSKGVKVKNFAAGGWANGVGMAQATPGGLLRVAEAGYDEAIISTDPKYRNRSIGLVQEMAARLGMWQQGSGAVSAPAVNVAAPSLEGMSITGTLDIGGDGLVRIIDGRLVKAFPSAGAITSEFPGR